METLPESEPLLRSRMPELDTVRGIAVLMVVLYHGLFYSTYFRDYHLQGFFKTFVSLTQGGWLGVQLFFVLSGFLITGILLDSKSGGDYFKRFYWRRALRILPPYLLLLLVLLVFGFIQFPFFFASLFFVSNLAFLFGIAMQYGVFWTLAVEEQFYLIWPQVVKRVSLQSLTFLAVGVIILTPLLRWVAYWKGDVQGLFYYSWLNMDGLAMGAMLAIFFRNMYTTAKTAKWIGSIFCIGALAAIIIGAPFGILVHDTFLGGVFRLTVFQFFFSGAIILFLVLGTSTWKKWVNIAPLQYLGKISYGLYLVHWFMFVLFDMYIIKTYGSNPVWLETPQGLLLRLLIAGGAAVIVAGLSRKYYESFFLSLKDKLT